MDKQVPPLTEPLENIEEIERGLQGIKGTLECAEITADQVALAVLPTIIKINSEIINASFIKTIAGEIKHAFGYADQFIEEMNRRNQCSKSLKTKSANRA